MARHLVPATLDHFSELSKRVTSQDQLARASAFNRVSFISRNVRQGEIRYSNAYKTVTGNLGRLPMYAMVDGIHHPKWVALQSNSERRVGSRLFSILLRTQSSSIGSKANHLHAILNEGRDTNAIHRVLVGLPFANNPAACVLPEAERAIFAQEAIDNISQLPEHFYTLREKSEYKGTYNELHHALGTVTRGGHFSNFTFKKGTISVCYGTLIDFTNKRVLAMLTLNPDFQEYYLLHKYSKSTKKLHPQIFNIVIDEEFAKNTGELYAKELFRMVRKGMCDAVEDGVTTEVIDGSEFFNELYGNHINGDVAAPLNPLEQIEENAEVQRRFISQTVTADTLRERNIVLID